MTRLVAALEALGLDREGEVALAGTWVTLHRARCRVYVAEVRAGTAYFTWCDHPRERTVQVYPDPADALLAGIRRAENPGAVAVPVPAG